MADLLFKNGSSEKRTMVTLYRNSRNIPASIPETKLDTQINVERQYAQALLELNQGSGLISTVGNIEAGLHKLDENKPTMALKEAFTPEFTTVKVEAKERMQKRDELTSALRANLEENNKLIPEAIEAISQNNTSKADTIISKMKRAEVSVTQDLGQLIVNEDNLQKKLDKLHHKVFDAVPPDVRAGLKQPAALEQESKRLGR